MYLYRLVFVLLLGLYLLSPILIDTWADTETFWLRPFVIWLLVILLIAWLEQKRNNDV